tara:strand:- start:1480 stop:2319 length:840 start_codon:yes stop_codon:yes gene_type:complete
MPSFNANNLCPNCNGGTHLPQGQGIRCHGVGFETYFICTREEQSEGCKEVDTGFLHAYINCYCGKPHDGTTARVAPPHNQPNQYKEHAEELWNQTIEPEGTDTHDYLRNRGIEILSDQIRHHPSLIHTPTRLYCEGMVVRISDSNNQFMGIERHFIDGGAKAFESQNKMILGSVQGGSVKLANLDGSGILGVAEGVITAMTITQELEIPCWAVLGASNLQHLSPPNPGLVKTIKIFTDGDAEGIKACDKAGDKWLKQGYEVLNCVAPESVDYNDILNEG